MTDHQPLVKIFGPIAGISSVVALDNCKGGPCAYPLKSRQSDIGKIIEQLQSSCVTKSCSKRQYKGYPNFESNMIAALDKVKLYQYNNTEAWKCEWIIEISSTESEDIDAEKGGICILALHRPQLAAYTLTVKDIE